jgi:hypothetical protein
MNAQKIQTFDIYIYIFYDLWANKNAQQSRDCANDSKKKLETPSK